MAPVRFFKRFLERGIAFGRDSVRLEALETHFFEKDADLRGAAFESGELLNELDSLRDAGWWMVSEIGLQRVVMGLQLAGGTAKLQLFERLKAARLILFQVAAYGIFTDADTRRNLMVRHAFRF